MADNCVRRMRRNGLRMAVLIAGLLAMVGARAAITVDSVRLHRAPDHTRIVFDLPEPVEHTLDKLADPDRVVVDLMDADLAFDVSALDYKDSPIENIRVGKHEDKTRVVFDVRAAGRPRTHLLKPVGPHRSASYTRLTLPTTHRVYTQGAAKLFTKSHDNTSSGTPG